MIGAIVLPAHLSADQPTASNDIFAKENLVAWCVVPFDTKQRSPAERAAMLQRLGLRKLAYDWRESHVATFEDEIVEMKKHGIEFFAFWLRHPSFAPLVAKHKIRPQFWLIPPSPKANTQQQRIEMAARSLLPTVEQAGKLGCKVGLYNHGGWSGEPDNLVAITRWLHDNAAADHVGIVYNLHHGHGHINDFEQALATMKPYLLCLNINGMNDDAKPKILPLGTGRHDLAILKTIRRSNYQGPIGILDHRDDTDAEQSLKQNLQGLRKLRTAMPNEPVMIDESPCPVTGDKEITDRLKTVRQKYNIPAIAGAIVTSRGLVAVGVAGVRKRGTKIPATLNDKWHLGSETKAMTAALVGRMVEQGLLKWSTTVAEVFPEMSAGFHSDMKSVTVLHLLSHRSGLPRNLKWMFFLGDAAPQIRLQAVRKELAKPPKTAPGSTCEYSNLGYVIVGAMIEKVTGDTWQKCITRQIFEPLQMKSVGFGGTGTPGRIDQPWGHTDAGRPVRRNGPSIDNPPVMGPAGRVHCTIQDWGLFVADQLRGAQGGKSLLKHSTYRTLHTPPFGGDYALGWVVTTRPWSGGQVLNHDGSNRMNYATVWVAPQRDFAVLVCTNQGGDTAEKASDAAATALIEYYGKRSITKAKSKP